MIEGEAAADGLATIKYAMQICHKFNNNRMFEALTNNLAQLIILSMTMTFAQKTGNSCMELHRRASP